MLTHGNLAANVAGVLAVLDLNEEDTALSFLPLCHAFERTVACVCLASGVSLIFAESIDTIARDLLRVRPTVMSAVPRVFEKLHARILEKGAQTSGLRRKVFDWALSVAARRGERIAAGRPIPATLALASRIADASGVREDSRQHRRPASLGRIRQRAPQSQHRELLSGRRPADPGGLRTDGNRASPCGDTARKDSPRHGRTAVAEPRGANRGRWGSAGSWAEPHARVFRAAGPDAGRDRRRLVSHRRRRRARRQRLSQHHRPQEGTARHFGRQEDRAAAHRGTPAGASPGERGDACRRPAAFSGRAHRAELSCAGHPAADRREHRPLTCRCRRGARALSVDRRRRQSPPGPVRAHQEVRAGAGGVQRGHRRAHADAEDQAARCGGEVSGT